MPPGKGLNMGWDKLKNDLTVLLSSKQLKPDREILLAIMEKLDKIEAKLENKNQ
jgi:hypothetical protein